MNIDCDSETINEIYSYKIQGTNRKRIIEKYLYFFISKTDVKN